VGNSNILTEDFSSVRLPIHEWGRRGMHIGYWWESQREKRPLGRPRRRWVDNIKMDLREI
jgi:hypothetical protein